MSRFGPYYRGEKFSNPYQRRSIGLPAYSPTFLSESYGVNPEATERYGETVAYTPQTTPQTTTQTIPQTTPQTASLGNVVPSRAGGMGGEASQLGPIDNSNWGQQTEGSKALQAALSTWGVPGIKSPEGMTVGKGWGGKGISALTAIGGKTGLALLGTALPPLMAGLIFGPVRAILNAALETVFPGVFTQYKGQKSFFDPYEAISQAYGSAGGGPAGGGGGPGGVGGSLGGGASADLAYVPPGSGLKTPVPAIPDWGDYSWGGPGGGGPTDGGAGPGGGGGSLGGGASGW